MKKTIKIELLPMTKVAFLKEQQVPEGTTQDDYSYISIKVGTKTIEQALIGAKWAKLSDQELIAIVFQGITESLYNHSKEDNTVVIEGQEVELTQRV